MRRAAGLALAMCLACGMTACNHGGRPELVVVQGKLLVDNRPATNAIVWFCPVDKAEGTTRRSRGIVDAGGNFSIGTYRTGDGVPAGKYRVAITWRAPATSGDEEGESLIAERYVDPAQSGLPIVEVGQEPLILQPFLITSD
jgi:hypothetical protein